jgi:cytosine/adenosine deaminase-related metal-dependent hydrolase
VGMVRVRTHLAANTHESEGVKHEYGWVESDLISAHVLSTQPASILG